VKGIAFMEAIVTPQGRDHWDKMGMRPAYAERLIGTIRRECLGHMIVFASDPWEVRSSIIISRAFIAHWTRMPRRIARLSALAS
jgi:hypothetical protein